MAKGAVEAVVAKLVLEGHKRAGPKQEVQVLTTVLEDYTEDFVRQVKQVAGSMRD